MLLTATQTEFIEGWTQEILLKYSARTGNPVVLPVPIFEIAERYLRLRVDIEKFAGTLERVSGICIPAKHWILLNSAQSMPRMRFSLAHEILHWLVEEYPDSDLHNERRDFDYLRSSDPQKRERAAEYFAAAILMPRALVRELVVKDWSDDGESLQRAARLFNVSPRAMEIRLRQISGQVPLHPELESQILGAYRNTERDQGLPPPRYTLVRPPSSGFDHRFIRYLNRRERAGKVLYFLLNTESQSALTSLLELNYGDGFVFYSEANEGLASELTKLDVVEYVDLAHLFIGSEGVLDESAESPTLSPSVFVHTRDSEDEIESKQLVFDSISECIRPDNIMHTRTHAKKYIRKCQKEGKKVVVVTGCFDVITNAHVHFLRQAKAAADILVVGIESDQRITAFKGRLRPVSLSPQRVEVLEELRCVDFTFVIYGSPRQDAVEFYTRLHAQLRADYLAVTEGDPHIDDRREEIEQAGGELVVIDRIEERSSSSLLRQFLAETEFSDLVFVRKRQLYQWAGNGSGPIGQPRLPFHGTGQALTSLSKPHED